MINLIIRPVTSHVLRSIVGRPPNARKPSFSPLSLFANGEQGAWYDPSDTTTLFQDSAGTTPVTASGQPVGLMLDKSGRGNHATQPTAGSRPIYHRGDSRGVVNQLLNSSMALGTEGAVPTSWIERGLVTFRKSGNVAVLTSGGGLLAVSDDARQSMNGLVAGATYTVSFLARTGAGATSSTLNLSEPYATPSSVALSGAFQRYAVTILPTGTSHSLFFGGASGLVAEITDVQVNLGPTALPYQRNDGNLGGVATGASTDLHWLETDGVDDGMVTGSIDFTGTDKVSLFAGVRKLVDGSTSVVLETSAISDYNNGAFALFAPTGIANNSFNFRSRGTSQVENSVANQLVAPASAVLTGIASISGDLSTIRKNGVSLQTLGTDQGTGNFGNYPLYLFRRAGTSLPFNGWFYGLAITGRLTTDAETVATERFLGKKSAVVIP